jgi:predicted dehydrogenase
MNKLYTAVVLGLGRIGAAYPSGNIPRTHTAAYLNHLKVNLIAAIDPDPDTRDKFKVQWGHQIKLFTSVKNMLADGIFPDIASICTNPSILQNNVQDYMVHPPKFFFLEKPTVLTSEQSKELLKIVGNIPVAVNYHRCWDPNHKAFFDKLIGKEIFTVRVLYSKGLLNYASHIIALLIQNFGDVDTVLKVYDEKVNNDLSDPSYSFILNFKKGFKAVFQGFDNINYDLLELDFITGSGIYSLKSGGCRQRYEQPVENYFYPDYTSLTDSHLEIEDGQVGGLYQAIENIVDYLDKKTNKIQCDLKCGLDVFSIIKQVKELN